jgi:acyl carrier protein
MDEIEIRLRRCFSAVFPSLSGEDILKADAANLGAWDSVASVTLFATIEEEFAIELDVQDAAELLSFAAIVDYLRLKKVS